MNTINNTVAVLGGGAAGFFGAIACAEANPQLTVYLIEKTGKLLSKVRIFRHDDLVAALAYC